MSEEGTEKPRIKIIQQSITIDELKPRVKVINQDNTVEKPNIFQKSRIKILSQTTETNLQPPQLSESRIKVALKPNTLTYEQMIEDRNKRLRVELGIVKTQYAGRKINTPIILQKHNSQKYYGNIKDGERIFSCVVASVLNALTALKIQTNETEDSLIQKIGGVNQFENGFLNVSKFEQYFRTKNLLVKSSNISLLQLLQTLEKGGVAILVYGNLADSHAQLVSGFETNNGNITLRINDPLPGRNHIQKVYLENIINEIATTNQYHHISLIEKQHSYNKSN